MGRLLDIQDLTISFGNTEAVNNISFSVDKNEIVGIAGESGSGKSLTSLSILRLLPPNAVTTGQIFLSGNELLKLDNKAIRKVRGTRIAMIFQEPMSSLNPVFTCGEQVMESNGGNKKRVLQLFEKVKLPDPERIFKSYPHQLSGGQKQRVMIAMAMSGNPELLICDEPTTALDVTVQQSVLELIRSLQAETGMGVIFISHDLGVISQISDRIIIMHKGVIVEQGKTMSVLQNPAHAYTRKLIDSKPSGVATPSSTLPKPFIEVEGVTVCYGKLQALKNLSFEIYSGETLGIVGESGCGKTTLGRTLLQLLSPTSGHIRYPGISFETTKAFRKKAQIVFQDPYSSLNPSIKIGEAIEEPLRIHEPLLSAQQRRERVMAMLQKTGLSRDHYTRYPHEFSGGQRQRIVICRALILNPDFVVCDESVSALDMTVQAQVLELLRTLKKELGFTCVFISHDLAVIRSISDRIMVMWAGRVEEIGTPGQIYADPRSAYTKKLLAASAGLQTFH